MQLNFINYFGNRF